jgi:LCP family protein required for cell wall assembly
VLAATGVGFVYWKTGRFQRADVTLDKVTSKQAPRNYLIIGSDSRANIDPSAPDAAGFFEPNGAAPSGRRSDTILLVRVDPVAGDTKMLSFPRDLWVDIAGAGHKAKINSAYGQGRQALVDTIRQDFGLEVNNYIEVDFEGFQSLVNALDGVPMYFDTAMRDELSGLDVPNAGCVSLNGDQALAFARSRHLEYKDSKGRWQSDPTADLGRITRQQIFVRKAMTKALSLGLATNPKTFFDLLNIAVDNVTIDQTIDRGDLKELIDKFASYKPEEMKTFSLPVTNGTSSDGQSILNLKTNQAQPVLNIFRGVDVGPVLESDVTVDVQTARNGALRAKDVQAALGAVGFVDGALANATPTPTQTTVRYAPGSEAAADLVARHLSTPAVLQADPSLGADRIVLVVGPDFTTVTQTPRAAAPVPTTTTTAPANGVTTTTAPPPPTTATTVVGVTPGTAPDGVKC